MCRDQTTAGFHDALCAAGYSAKTPLSLSFGNPKYQNVSQFIYDQYAHANFPANPMLMSTAPYASGQLCSTVGVGQPGYGNALGCVARADSVKILPKMAANVLPPGFLAAATGAVESAANEQCLLQKQHNWFSNATLAHQFASAPKC